MWCDWCQNAAALTRPLQTVLNKLLENDEERPYSFYVNDVEIDNDVDSVLKKLQQTTEDVLQIVYQPQALFRVRAVSRCSASLSGKCKTTCYCVGGTPLLCRHAPPL